MDSIDRETGNDRVRSLERRYIDLLEKRIQDLEAIVGAGAESKKRTSTKKRPGAEKDESISRSKTATNEFTLANDASRESSTPLPYLVHVRERLLYDDGVAVERDCDPSEVHSADPKPANQKLSSANSSSKALTHKLTWLKVLSPNGNYKNSEFTVAAPELKALLSVMLAHYPGLHISPFSSSSSPYGDGGDPIKFESPFTPLVHNWDRLKVAARTGDAAQDSDSPEIAELKSRIAKLGPRVDGNASPGESQATRALMYLGKNDNLQQARLQLSALLTHVAMVPELSGHFSSLDAKNDAKTIEFQHLWTIFPPGEIVYSTVFMDEPQLFIVKDSNGEFLRSAPKSDGKGLKLEIETETTDAKWSMVVWSYDWNGSTFQRVPVHFSFSKFTGTRAISTLHCHPLRFHEMGGSSGYAESDGSIVALEKMLLERGKRFKELCVKQKGSQMFDYQGDAILRGVGFQKFGAWDTKDLFSPQLINKLLGLDGSTKMLSRRQRIRGRVMVDFQAFLRYASNWKRSGPMGSAMVLSGKNDECQCLACSSNQALRDNQKGHYDTAVANTEFEDLQYMICPPRALGYHLESRAWLELNVGKQKNDTGASAAVDNYLKDIVQQTSDEAFKKLQLARTQKTLIKDLVQSHASGTNSKPWMEDIMRDKGRGLIILLHGPPGVGKTLTAESVAQLAGKPLLSVGASDIGLKPEDVERNLEALFELAANWRAVLLFDEADVFLESRSSHTSDLNRNALVSVLLRILEYYNGILILTTNRIREFDVAVQSRVNLGIKYEDLDRDQKQAIFENFIKQLPEDKIRDREGIAEWFKEDEEAREWGKALNGRQIRNILFSATNLAERDGDVLKLDHVKKMTKSTSIFYDGIKSIVDDARRKAEAGGRL